MAKNKQALAQYTWVEQDTISLKGEQKKQDQYLGVTLGPDEQDAEDPLSTQPLRHRRQTSIWKARRSA